LLGHIAAGDTAVLGTDIGTAAGKAIQQHFQPSKNSIVTAAAAGLGGDGGDDGDDGNNSLSEDGSSS